MPLGPLLLTSVALQAASPAAPAVCPIALVGATKGSPWGVAVAEAEARTARPDSDCDHVEVAVRPNGALLTFFTRDGRHAVRALLTPDELAATLDALLVRTVAPPTPHRPDPPPAPEQSAPTPAATTPLPANSPAVAPPLATPLPANSPAVAPPLATPLPANSPAAFHVGVGVGGRLGLAGPYLAPALQFRPAGTIGPWEIAATAEYNPRITYVGAGAPAFQLWVVAAEMEVARRHSFGRWALGYGAGLTIASVHEEASETDGTAKAIDFAQPRAALHARLFGPAVGRWRFVAGLAGDAALGSVKRKATLRNDLPDLPRFGLVLTVGTEATLAGAP